MNFLNRPLLAAIGVAGVLSVGALGAGIVMAQEPGDATPIGERGTTDFAPHEHCRPAGEFQGFAGLAAIIQASGLEPGVFATGFQDGMTVGEVLEANGLDPDAVVADALDLIQARVDEAVANGVIDADRASEIMANAGQRLNDLLDTTPDRPHGRHHRGPWDRGHHGPYARAGLEVAAEAIGISGDELRDALMDGSTIAEVAEANGVDPATVIDAILEPLFQRIDDAVANGRLSAEDAADRKAEATGRVTDFVNNGPMWTPDATTDEASLPTT